MQEYNYFPHNINTGKSGINSKEKSQPIILIYPPISKNSYILTDNELSENRVLLNGNNYTKMNINELKQNDNYIRNIKLSKTSNNYYKKRDYKKFLNAVQSVNCSTTVSNSGIGRNISNFRISEPNRNIYKNLNSYIDEEKNLYNKLNTKDLIEMTQRRKKIIEEKKLQEERKKQMMLQEEEQLKENIIINNNFENFENNKNFCDEGVQTSLKMVKNNNEKKNLKESKNNTEIDLVNIGSESTENINNDLNLSTMKKSIDMQFNVINNNTLLSNTNKNYDEEKFNLEINSNKNLKKSIDEEKKFINKNILSDNEIYIDNNSNNISSNKDDNEMTQVQEFDQKNINFQNESKIIFSEYEKSLEKNNEIKKDLDSENSSLSDYYIELNNEKISYKNRYGLINNLTNDQENLNFDNKIGNNLLTENNINSKKININFYNDFNSALNNNINSKINSCKNNNFESISQNKKNFISLNPNNINNRRYSSNMMILPDKDICAQNEHRKSTSLNKIIYNSNIDITKKGVNVEKNIISDKNINSHRNNIGREKSNFRFKSSKLIHKKMKKKRQLNNYADYYKLKISSNKEEKSFNKININGITNDKNLAIHKQNNNSKNFNFSLNYNSQKNNNNSINHDFGTKGKKYLKTDKNFYTNKKQNNFEEK